MSDEFNKALCEERHKTLARERKEDRKWHEEQNEITRELIRVQASPNKAWAKLIPWIVAALLAGGGGGAALTGIPTAGEQPTTQTQP